MKKNCINFGWLILVDLLITLFYYFIPLDYKDGLTTFFTILLFGAGNILIALIFLFVKRLRKRWSIPFGLNAIAIYIIMINGAILSTKALSYQSSLQYNIIVNDSLFVLDMDRDSTSAFRFYYREAGGSIGEEFGTYSKTGDHTYVLKVDTTTNFDRYRFKQCILRDDSIYGFRKEVLPAKRVGLFGR